MPVRDRELMLARLRIFGFTITRETHEVVEVRRESRVSVVHVAEMRCTAADPRDAFLLALALGDDTRWSPRACRAAGAAALRLRARGRTDAADLA